VCYCFLASSPAIAQNDAPTTHGTKELTIESIYQPGGLLGRGPEAVKWSPDGSKVSFVQRDDSGESGALYYVDTAAPGKPAVLVASAKLASLAPPTSAIKDERKKEAVQRYSVAAYHWSPDSKKLLFDSMGQLWLYNVATATATQMTSSADASGDPKFSPDGERIAFVRKHNLFTRGVNKGEERALTKDGDPDLLNGEVDWVYEEELYTRSNYFWSPDGNQIAYLQMNEKDVPSYPITDWIPLNPDVDKQKYPKPGEPNPGVRLGVVSANGGKTKWISGGGGSGGLPIGNDPGVLIPRFGWVREGMLWVMVMNRVQTRLDLYFVDLANGRSKLMMTEESDAWIDMGSLNGQLPDADFALFSSGDHFLWRSWRDGHYHLYLYQFDKQNPMAGEAKPVAQLTHGDWEVTGISAVDEQHGVVYFTANKDDWRQENVYSVGFDGKNLQRISKENGTHSANFYTKNPRYYVDEYSALTTPPRMSLCTSDGDCHEFWQSRAIEEYHLLTPKFVDFKAADGTTTLQGAIILPTGGPMMANGKAPLILNPYGGPGAQTVRDEWGTISPFDQILARKGFAVLKVDNRGMANRGRAFAAPIKKNLGETEFNDQVAAIKQALQQFPQLDQKRLGFWGWSYGGYFTLYTLEHTDMFKGGVAVAPVTDWRNYDTIYTERYMLLPKDNVDGYHNSSPVNYAADLYGKLLEVHGTSDDNVHMQNTIQMVNAFINAGKQFQLMLYPRKTHGIGGAPARTHLFHMIEDHFEEILAPEK
jgi:dipeptidyl-peptidase-4